jgi:hypothetical protein
MMSCWEYFTVLAPGSARAGVASSKIRQKVIRTRLNLGANVAFEILFILFLLN